MHDTGCECLKCEAERHMTPGDWRVVRFFVDALGYVQRVVLPDRLVQYPDLAAWMRLCELRGDPMADRRDLIDGARFLLDAVEGRAKKMQTGVYRHAVADLMPPPEPAHG